MEPKRVVAAGYDAAAETYAAAASRHAAAGSERRQAYVDVALRLAAPGARVLDAGCGTGEHATARLASRYRVVGVDISERSVQLARPRVPDAAFVVGDMATIQFPSEVFDLVTAFYSLIHVPRDEHAAMLASAWRWLRPGGHLVVTMGQRAWEGVESEWHGAPTMYWSHWDAATNKELVAAAGFRTITAEEVVTEEDGHPVGFLWVVAQRP
jgi:ubiquinone/menaquinone biosynthesis C-methylase UbiE